MREEVSIAEGEQVDRLGCTGLRIIQHPGKFKFTLDAFLLAAFVHPRAQDRLVDLGTGGGVISILLAGQNELETIYGLEIQPPLADMARRSVQLNGLTSKIQILEGDLRNFPSALKENSFDWVIANPPFFRAADGMIPENSALATAKFEITCTLADLAKAAGRLVKGNGKVAVIYPAERLGELIEVFSRHHLVVKVVCPIYPREESKAILVLIQAKPGGRSGLTILPPIVVYTPTGEYTKAMRQIYNGEKLL